MNISWSQTVSLLFAAEQVAYSLFIKTLFAENDCLLLFENRMMSTLKVNEKQS